MQLQVDTWGPADATPTNQLVISVQSGDHVIGAFAGRRRARLVEIPRNFQALKVESLEKARKVRPTLREELGGLFRIGHTVVGLNRERSALVVE